MLTKKKHNETKPETSGITRVEVILFSANGLNTFFSCFIFSFFYCFVLEFRFARGSSGLLVGDVGGKIDVGSKTFDYSAAKLHATKVLVDMLGVKRTNVTDFGFWISQTKYFSISIEIVRSSDAFVRIDDGNARQIRTKQTLTRSTNENFRNVRSIEKLPSFFSRPGCSVPSIQTIVNLR